MMKKLSLVQILLASIELFGFVSTQLFVTDPVAGRIYQIDTSKPSIIQKTFDQRDQVVGIAYDDGRWFQRQPTTESIAYSSINGGIYRQYLNNSKPILLLDLSTYRVFADRIAIDPTSGNIYFNAVYFVGLVTPAKYFVAIFYLDSGREIAVVPSLGFLFWSDHGFSFPHIGRANMDGSGAKAIVDTSRVWPNGLSVDHRASKLYWVDGFLHKIERCNFDGTDRVVLALDTGIQFMDILVDGDWLYVTEWSNRTLQIYNKTNTLQNTTITIPNTGRLDSLAINSAFSSLKQVNQACATRYGLGVCSEVCLPSSDGNVTCACNDTRTINSDGKTCPNGTLCPTIANGNLSSECSRFLYETCDFSCMTNYEKTEERIWCVGTEWNTTSPCQDIDECEADPCDHDCTNTDGSYTCSCMEGYDESGNKCLDIDECKSSPCQHLCNNTGGSYSCSCEEGYEAAGNVCRDTDECERKPCQQICTNTNGSFFCSCESGYQQSGNNCNDIDECSTNPCSHNCTNVPGSYYCSCWDNYRQNERDNSQCTAIGFEVRLVIDLPFLTQLLDQDSFEFIQLASNVTAQIDASINASPLNGSYIGSTVNGFSSGSVVANASLAFNSSTVEDGNPIDPANITDAIDNYTGGKLPITNTSSSLQFGQDECKANLSNCQQVCTDRVIGYSCSCFETHMIDPLHTESCIDIDECVESTHTCEQICNNTDGGFTCTCIQGFDIDSTNSSRCVDIDECTYGTDQCQQLCENTNGGYTCKCEYGYVIDESDSTKCNDVDECTSDQNTCENACENTMGSFKCTCSDGYVTDSTDQSKCRVPLLHYGESTGDNFKKRFIRECVGPMVFEDPIPLFSKTYNDLYPCSNGFVSIGQKYLGWFPFINKNYEGHTILSPLFTAMDFRYGGALYYNHYNKQSTNKNQTDNIERTEKYIGQMDNNAHSVHHMAVVTWHRARLYPGYYRTMEATFQMVLATDWTTTYLLYIYGENQMQWQIHRYYSPTTLIGYIINGGVKSDVSFYSNTPASYRMDQFAERNGYKGILLYKMKHTLGGPTPTTLCLDWYNSRKNLQEIRRHELVQCPCTKQLIEQNLLFRSEESNSNTVNPVQCYITWPRWRTWPNAMRCCYDNTGSWISRKNGPGGILAFHLDYFVFFYDKFDFTPWKYCCLRSSRCDLYRELRPVGTCFTETPNSFAGLFGDPHIVTLDGKEYTFNGWGEYMLLAVNVSDVNFELQGRTEKAVNSSGKATEATVFTAFAATDHFNATLHVQLDENKTGLVVYGNGVDLSLDFNNFNKPFNFTAGSLVLYRKNNTLNVLFTSLDISLRINVDTNMLGISLNVPKVLKGMTSGLLGNFDNDTENDFILRNGTQLNPSSSERELFPFGQSWMVSSSETLFLYFDQLDYSNYSHPEFVPRFIDEVPSAVVENATSFCGDRSPACIYDLVLTGTEEIAISSNNSEKQSKLAKIIENNSLPVLNGTGRIYANVGEEVNVYIEANDEGAVDFTVSGNASLTNVTGVSAVLTWIPDMNSALPISVTGIDSLGMSSPALQFDIVLCNGCSGHGRCDYTQIQSTSSSYLPIAMCVCNGFNGIPFWSGTSCEIDYDGCSTSPCSIDQDCEDLNATQHEAQQKSYLCGPCPEGFEDDGIKCSSIDECAIVGICDQICVDTDTGFYCLCEAGFRTMTNDQSKCEDVNECDEALHQCEHVCINAPGSYNCSCYAGYQLNDTRQCIRDTVVDECMLNGLDCSSTAGCTNETGMFRCFCKNGYELSTNGTACMNINECSRNVCPQTCTDTVGSFFCSCYVGYMLQEDRVTCQDCDSFHWGINCENQCICGQGTEACDHIHGCFCRHGWTDINECANPSLNTCQYTCLNVPGSFVCSCIHGYIVDPNNATQCIDFDECEAGISTCEQVCENVPGKFNCYCHFGYTLNSDRASCRKVEDLCALFGGGNCSHICKIEGTSVYCDCPKGFTIDTDNRTCKDVDECSSDILNRCNHPELCTNSIGGYTCSCPTGQILQNDQRQCKVCDAFHYGDNCAGKCECRQGSDYCDPVRGCVCKSGWLGKHCDVDKNECDGNVNICPGDYSLCENEAGGYSCKCQAGYTEDASKQCQDINECIVLSQNTCGQVCLNTNGSYICDCYEGFILRNGNCEDIDECSGHHGCQHVCQNIIGSYRCSCSQGYRLNLLNRKTCSVIDQCNETQNIECSVKNADCVILGLHPTCKCWKGYEKVSNGSGCEDIKECEMSPGVCEHVCTEETGSFNCSCHDGYFLDQDLSSCKECSEGTWGPSCHNMCSCSASNTASCNKTTGICQCKPGFNGSFCELDIDECNGNTFSCPLNSECRNTNGSYRCVCEIGFVKTEDGNCVECEPDHWGAGCIENCSCNILNTERCDNVNGTCYCHQGWASVDCSTDEDECKLEDTCQIDKERCRNLPGTYRCDCIEGYVKDLIGICIDLDECFYGLHSCPQVCNNTNGGYICDCFRGYRMQDNHCVACSTNMYGYNCSGTCDCNANNVVDVANSCDQRTGACLCKQEWQGQTCDHDVDECVAGVHSCMVSDHRICMNRQNGYDCVCDAGYYDTNNMTCKQDQVPEPAERKGVLIGVTVSIVCLLLLSAAAVYIYCKRKKSYSVELSYDVGIPSIISKARSSASSDIIPNNDDKSSSLPHLNFDNKAFKMNDYSFI